MPVLLYDLAAVSNIKTYNFFFKNDFDIRKILFIPHLTSMLFLYSELGSQEITNIRLDFEQIPMLLIVLRWSWTIQNADKIQSLYLATNEQKILISGRKTV